MRKEELFLLGRIHRGKGKRNADFKGRGGGAPFGGGSGGLAVPLTSKLHYDSGANALILRKTVSFNVAYKPAEPKLLRALALYRASQVLYGEKKTGLARSFAKFADLTLRSVRSEDEDDVMFASDTLFRLRDFSESRLTWVSKGKEEGYWATDLATPKVEKMFEMVKEATLRKAEYWSGDNLTDGNGNYPYARRVVGRHYVAVEVRSMKWTLLSLAGLLLLWLIERWEKYRAEKNGEAVFQKAVILWKKGFHVPAISECERGLAHPTYKKSAKKKNGEPVLSIADRPAGSAL